MQSSRPICWLVSQLQASMPLHDIARLPAVVGQLAGDAVPAAEGGALLPLASGTLLIIPVPRPLPPDVLVDDVQQNAAWKGWREAAMAWRSHVILSTLDNADTLEARRKTAANLLQLACDYAERVGADGLGWQASRLFVPLPMVRTFLQSTPLPPQLLIRCTGTTKGLETMGLAGFGLPELRDVSQESRSPAAVPRLWNLATYLIQNGPVIRDGDTIGVDERRTARVRHVHQPDSRLVLELGNTPHDPVP